MHARLSYIFLGILAAGVWAEPSAEAQSRAARAETRGAQAPAADTTDPGSRWGRRDRRGERGRSHAPVGVPGAVVINPTIVNPPPRIGAVEVAPRVEVGQRIVVGQVPVSDHARRPGDRR